MDSITYSNEYLAETQQTSIRNLNISIIVFALIFVAFRLFVRHRWAAGLAIDDWVILCSTVFFLVLAALNLLMIQHGVGLHLAAIAPEDFSVVLQALLGSEIAYTLTIALTKISILLMYCRIFPVKSLRRGAAVLGSITIAWAIAIISASIFQCTPIRKAWLPNVQGHCFNLKAYFIGNSAPNIATDFAILMLPMAQVWKLHTSITRKISITVMLLLGSFVIAASIYRFIQLLTFDASDFTWTTALPSTWTVVEAAAALASACLPALGPALRPLQAKLGIQTASSRSGNVSNTPIDLVTIGGTNWRRDGAQREQPWGRSETDDFKRLEENSSSDRGREFSGPHECNTSKTSISKGSGATERDDGSGDEVPLNCKV